VLALASTWKAMNLCVGFGFLGGSALWSHKFPAVAKSSTATTAATMQIA